MSLLKRLWNWLVCKTSTAPKLAVVEEEPTPVEVEEISPEDPRGAAVLFGVMCRSAGVKNRDLNSTNAISLFNEWYDGPATEEEIRKVLWDFKEAHPGVAPKNYHTERIVAGDY